MQTHTFTLTHTPFTGATMHRNTNVTTILTLHIMSIVSKEKRFMELKHPQESSSARMMKLQAARSGHDWA